MAVKETTLQPVTTGHVPQSRLDIRQTAFVSIRIHIHQSVTLMVQLTLPFSTITLAFIIIVDDSKRASCLTWIHPDTCQIQG